MTNVLATVQSTMSPMAQQAQPQQQASYQNQAPAQQQNVAPSAPEGQPARPGITCQWFTPSLPPQRVEARSTG